MLKRILPAGAIVLATTMAASAADVPPIAPPPPPPPPPPVEEPDWTGPYYGGWGALTFGRYCFDQTETSTNVVALQRCENPGESFRFFSAGAIAGYDVQFNSIVTGVNFRAGYTFTDEGDPTDRLSAEGGVRAGLLFGDLLAYANAALGYSGLAGPYWAAGGGLEFALNEIVHVFGEGRFTDNWTIGQTSWSIIAGITLR